MPREHEQRPRKKNALKARTDGVEKRSENISGTDGGDLNLRTERRDFTPGRSRDAPDSDRDTTALHKEQARRFTEQSAQRSDTQTPDNITGGNLAQTNDTCVVPTAAQTTGVQEPDYTSGGNSPVIQNEDGNSVMTQRDAGQKISRITDDGISPTPNKTNAADLSEKTQPQIISQKNAPVLRPPDRESEPERNNKNPINQKSFDKLRTDKQMTPRNAEASDKEKSDKQPFAQKPLRQGQSSERNSTGTLSHTHEPRSAQRRSPKLRYNAAPVMPGKSPRRKPVSSDAAKYIPPGMERRETPEPQGNINYTPPVENGSVSANIPASDNKQTETSEFFHEKPTSGGTERINNGSEYGSERSRADKPDKLRFDENKTSPYAEAKPSGKSKLNNTAVPVDSGTDLRQTSAPHDNAGYIPFGETENAAENNQHGADETPPNTNVRDSGAERANHGSGHGSARSLTAKPGRLQFSENKSADVTLPVKKKPNVRDNDNAPANTNTEQRETPATDDSAEYTPSNNANSENTDVPDTAENHLPETKSSEGNRGTDSAKPVPESGGAQKRADKPGKLKFTENEIVPAGEVKPPGKKLEKARYKAERSAKKLDKARNKLPKKRRVTLERSFDEKIGKPKQKLRFDGEVKSMGEHIKGPLVTRPFKAGANMAVVHAHRKLYQVEHENVGTQAAHKGAMIAESGLRTAYRHHKTAPYRKIQKLEARTAKLNIKASYQQVLNDNPKLKSNAISRMAQKRKIKKQYAKAAREAQRTGKNVEKTAVTAGKIAQKVVGAVKSHPIVLLIIGIIFLLIILISSVFTAFSGIASNAGSSVLATTYLAEDADIDSAELFYTEWEADLRLQIQNAASGYPGYNEYRYNIDGIGHDPHELMAFLTIVYGEFQYADIEIVLKQIFDEQYQLSFTPSREIRYYTDAEGNSVPYDWNVLTVTLITCSFYDVVYPLMSDEQRQQYSLLTMSGGNRQYAESPFPFNWRAYVTSGYGYRVHPITGVKDYHKGVDIAVPAGTEIQSAQNGTVTFAGWDDSYGYYVVIDDGNGLVTKYAHCESLLVSTGQAVNTGDIIAKVGSTGDSTGPHLHYEIIKDGIYLNAIYFSK